MSLPSSFDVGVTAPAAPVVVVGGVVASDTQGVFARSTDGLDMDGRDGIRWAPSLYLAAVTVSGSMWSSAMWAALTDPPMA